MKIHIQILVVLQFAAIADSAAGINARVDWIRQYGTVRDDYGTDVVATSTGVVIVGGEFGGHVSSNDLATFLRGYDSSGDLAWSQAFSSPYEGRNIGLAMDGFDNSYVLNSKGGDLLLTKLDSDRAQVWHTSIVGEFIGWPVGGLAADSDGNVFVATATPQNEDGMPFTGLDAYIAKISPAGEMEWAHQFGSTKSDLALDVAVSVDGSVFAVGSTADDLGGENAGQRDAFIRKYNSTGDILWTRQFGDQADEQGNSVAADAFGNVYLGTDAYDMSKNIEYSDIMKLDASGQVIWNRRIGGSSVDRVFKMISDSKGNLIVAGPTNGDLAGENAGPSDVFVRKYDSAGSDLWTLQFGGEGSDDSMGLTIDSNGNIYATGFTQSPLGGEHFGGSGDAYIAKIVEVPEPKSIFYLLTFGALLRRERNMAKKDSRPAL